MNAGKPTDSAARLIALGYRRTSHKYKMVSRIDRPDWGIVLAISLNKTPAEFCLVQHPGGNKRGKTFDVVKEITPMWRDYYRRVISGDTLIVEDRLAFQQIPGSDWDEAGYVDPASVPEDAP